MGDTLDEILGNIQDIDVSDRDIKFLSYKGGTSSTYSKEKYRGYSKLTTNKTLFGSKMRARRAVIRVHPGNVRDAVIMDNTSTNNVLYISNIIQKIVYKLPESAMKSTSEGEDIKLINSEDVLERYNYCYTRDFKKSGLTMPKEILEVVAGCLKKRFPSRNI